MFKSKWQKKYELAMKDIEFWRDYYDEQSRKDSQNSYLYETGRAQTVALTDVLRRMKRIAESK